MPSKKVALNLGIHFTIKYFVSSTKRYFIIRAGIFSMLLRLGAGRMDTWKQQMSIGDKVHDHMELMLCPLHCSNTPDIAMLLLLYLLLSLPYQIFPASFVPVINY